MIYLTILAVLILFALLYDVLNMREARTVSYWGTYLILVALAGFRFKVGGDTYNYMYTHELLPNLSDLFSTEVGIAKLQPLWLLFSATAKSIGEDFYILQFLHAIVVNAIIFRFIQKNTKFSHTGVLFYYFSLYPLFNFEILRESLAICFFLISIQHYTNRTWLRYYLLITIAFLFHLSAAFLYLLPLIRNINIKPIGLLFIFALATLLNPAMQEITSSSAATKVIGFAIGIYTDYNYTIFGLISIFILYLAIPFLLTKITQTNLKTNLNYIVIASKGLPIAALIPVLFIFYRFFNYFAILYMLMACEVSHSIIRSKKLKRIKLITVPTLFSLALIFYTGRYFSNTSEIVESTRWYVRWQPYHSIFDPISVPDRDRLNEIQNMGQQ